MPRKFNNKALTKKSLSLPNGLDETPKYIQSKESLDEYKNTPLAVSTDTVLVKGDLLVEGDVKSNGETLTGGGGSDANTTYTVSTEDHASSASKKHIRLTGSDSSTDDVTLVAGTGITLAQSSDEITITNSVTDTDTVLSTEQVQDIVGAMVSSNTETGITATYEDGDGTIDLVVDDTTKLPLAGGDMTGHLQITATDGGHSGSGAYVPSGTDWQNVLRLGSTSDNGINFLVNDGGTNKVSYYTNRWGSQHEWARGSEDTGDGNTYQPMMRLTSNDSNTNLLLYDGTSSSANVRITSESSNDTYFNNSDNGVAIGSPTASGYKLHVTGTTHITGALTVDSTVDGRDLQTDGTKLDGIEASATADQTAGEILTLIEDGVDSVHYKDGSIDTAHIADDQVTYAKIQNVSATDRILGRDSAGAGVIEEITPANLRTMLNVADGANANVSGDSGNSAIYDNSGTPTLKSGITQGEMQTAIGGVYTDTNTNQLTVWNYQIDSGSTVDVAHGQTLQLSSGNGIELQEDAAREFTVQAVNASASAKGVVELATTAETTTGTDATRAVTPDGLKDSGYMGFEFRQLINAGFNYSYTAGTKIYIPLVGYILERNSQFGANEYLSYVAPYDGYLNQVVFRSEEACGSTVVGFHKSSTGTEHPSATASDSVTVDMAADDTSYKFAFTGGMSGSAHQFSAGDIINISFDPTNDANDVVFTAEFILDSSSGL